MTPTLRGLLNRPGRGALPMTDELFRKQAEQVCTVLCVSDEDAEDYEESINYVEHNLRTAYRAGQLANQVCKHCGGEKVKE